jgi:hypothetical protein
VPEASGTPAGPPPGAGASDRREHDQDRARAAGLRRVALASAAALTAVLWFAVATAGSGHSGPHHGNGGHTSHAQSTRSLSANDD